MVTSIQNVISSAVTQNTALSSASFPVSTSGTSSSVGSVPDVALVQGVSNNVIQSSGLYTASIELAALSTQISTAQSGTAQITGILAQLSNIAQEIADGGDGESVSSLQAQFQTLYAQISQVVADASFGGSNLLNGSFSPDSSTLGSQDEGQAIPVVPSLTAQSLFGNTPPDVSTSAGSNAALNAIANAQSVVSGANDNLGALDSQVNFAIASVATAQFNGEASASVISEGDIASLGTTLLENPSDAASAQGDRLSSDTLSLLGE